jgi:hypothetical protein
MNEIPNMSAADRKKLMQPQEISEVFSQLGLQEEGEREKFRALAEVKTPENEKVRIFFTGTTSGLKELQGGNYA